MTSLRHKRSTMVENKKLRLLNQKEVLEDTSLNSSVGFKEGIPIEKGITLNEDYLI